MNGARSAIRIAFVLARREVVGFARQPARVAAAVGTPMLLWLLIGSGMAEAVKPRHLDAMQYSAFLLPGMMTLVVVFSSVFSSISLIEQRQSGWLQSVLVAPTPRWSIALGKMIGGSVIAWMQGAVLLLAVPFVHATVSVTGVVLSLAALALTALAMTGLGLALAWRSETTAGFHAVMNLLFMPMWLLSGAFFPASASAHWISYVIAINPLTWCNHAIRSPLAGSIDVMAFLMTGAFAVAMFSFVTIVIARRSKGKF